jgi:hypothetical protein
MRPVIWALLSLLVFGGGAYAIVRFRRRPASASHSARVVALVMMFYLMLFLLVLGGAPDWLFGEGARPFNREQGYLFLAGGGGLLAECAKWCKRLGRQTRRGAPVAPVFLDGFSGILCGLAALAIAGALRGKLSNLTDVQAGAAGIAGGWLGLGILDLAGVAYRSTYGLLDETKEKE